MNKSHLNGRTKTLVQHQYNNINKTLNFLNCISILAKIVFASLHCDLPESLVLQPEQLFLLKVRHKMSREQASDTMQLAGEDVWGASHLVRSDSNNRQACLNEATRCHASLSRRKQLHATSQRCCHVGCLEPDPRVSQPPRRGREMERWRDEITWGEVKQHLIAESNSKQLLFFFFCFSF